jgi:hypothetical protein
MEKGAKLGIPEWMQDENAPRKLFEVTCVVGEVWEDLNSQHTPREAAFNLIATHGADGDYTFPLENGDILHVIVETHING